ncbi:MAG: glycosyltransferase family 4 protein [Bacteroidales bacterium]|nr:glycosyltransferase family 4 protein [Bacteroidales bacterium]
MKILFLCNKSPWPPKEGGPMAMNMLIEGLVAAGHEVKVLAVNSFKYTITPEEIPPEYRERTGIELLEVDLRIKPFAAFFNLFTRKSYHVQRFISKMFRKRLTSILQESQFDVVQLETLFMCPYIKTIRRHSKAKIILRAHNIEHRIWERVAEETKNPIRKWYISHLAHTLKRYEKKIIREIDGIIAITPTDAEYFGRSIQNQGKIIDIPFGIDPNQYPVDFKEVEFPSLFTLGSMNWIPNQEGIRWFLTNVWLDIHNQFPTLKYYLAGREMPSWMRSLNLPNVIVLGEVEDARIFISSKAIMIVPLFSGSGIRIKIIEGMAMGKTIISTSLGAEGIDCSDRANILIANLPCEFFEMISVSVTDRSLCERIGIQARKLVEEKYQTKKLIQKLIGFYQYSLP